LPDYSIYLWDLLPVGQRPRQPVGAVLSSGRGCLLPVHPPVLSV